MDPFRMGREAYAAVRRLDSEGQRRAFSTPLVKLTDDQRSEWERGFKVAQAWERYCSAPAKDRVVRGEASIAFTQLVHELHMLGEH